MLMVIKGRLEILLNMIKNKWQMTFNFLVVFCTKNNTLIFLTSFNLFKNKIKT